MKKRAILFFMLICAVMILPFSVSATVEKTEFVQSTLSGDNSALKLYFSGKVEENAKVVIGNDTFDCEITENVPIRTVFLIDNTTSMSKVTNVVDIVRDYLSAISENESIAIVKFDKKTEQVTNGYIKDKYDIDTAFSKIKFDGEGSYIYDAIVETIKTMYENNNDYYKIVLITDGFDQSKSVSFDNLKNEVEKNARYHIDVVQATNYNQESKELKAIGALSTNTYTFCNNSKSNGSKTYVKGRTDNPQITIPFYAHRDNYRILEEAKKAPQEFLRVNPDMTGIKYSGEVDYSTDNTDVGSLIQGSLTITVNRYDGLVDNVSDLIENTAIITNTIPERVSVTTTGEGNTAEINVDTAPADATITAKSETTSVATVTASNKKVTITGVAAGTAIIEITTSATGCAGFKRTLLVEVTAA